jgi:F420-0:gamma-glutamyl ligase-like protein
MNYIINIISEDEKVCAPFSICKETKINELVKLIQASIYKIERKKNNIDDIQKVEEKKEKIEKVLEESKSFLCAYL